LRKEWILVRKSKTDTLQCFFKFWLGAILKRKWSREAIIIFNSNSGSTRHSSLLGSDTPTTIKLIHDLLSNLTADIP